MMIILDSTAKSLKVVLAGAVAATQLPVTTHYTDITATAYTPGSNDTVTNNATPVEIVAAPAASTQRHVESISVYNVDTAPATVTIQYVSAGGTRQIATVVLPSLYALYYEDGSGWQVIDANGATVRGTNVDDTAYAASWDGITTIAPSKNAVYDKMQLMAPLISPALVTPALGTPASGVLTNCTGYPVSLIVASTISDGDTTHAPDGNSIFDGLALKPNLATANSFTNIAPMTTLAESWIGPSSTAGIYFKGGNRGIGTTAPGAKLHLSNLTSGVNELLRLSCANEIGAGSKIIWQTGDNDGSVSAIENIITSDATASGHLLFSTYTAARGLTEAMRILGSGSVVLADGSFKSGTPNGGTAAPWKFGTLVTGQVGLVVLSTQYLQVDVNGTLIKLATI